MKYKITSPNYFKHSRWYLGSEIGISVDYWYMSRVSVTLDSEYLDEDEDGQEQLNDEISSMRDSAGPEDEWRMKYPAPYYFKIPEKSAIWSKPNWEKEKVAGTSSGLLIDAKKIKIKIDLHYLNETEANQKIYSTWDDDFQWIGARFSKAESEQADAAHQILAAIWNSEVWRDQDKLNAYFSDKYNVEIEDDEAVFFGPLISEINIR